MKFKADDQRIIEANKAFFERDAKDFDLIHDDPSAMGNWLTRIVTKYYCKDHIKIRMRCIAELVPGGMKGKRVCSLGCGPGRYPLYFHSLGARIVGVDYSPEMLKLAADNREKATVPEEECKFVMSDVLDFEDAEKFDVVIASGLIDYLPNHLGRKLLERMAHLVKKNGVVIVTFPFRGGVFNTLRYWLRSMQHVHTYYYSKDEIEGFLKSNNLVFSGRRDIVGYWIVSATKQG